MDSWGLSENYYRHLVPTRESFKAFQLVGFFNQYIPLVYFRFCYLSGSFEYLNMYVYV
jgi:hypothetical protein